MKKPFGLVSHMCKRNPRPDQKSLAHARAAFISSDLLHYRYAMKRGESNVPIEDNVYDTVREFFLQREHRSNDLVVVNMLDSDGTYYPIVIRKNAVGEHNLSAEAGDDFEQGRIIALYTGPRVSDLPEDERIARKYLSMTVRGVDRVGITVANFFDHTCKPEEVNVEVTEIDKIATGVAMFQTTRMIKRGERILWNYIAGIDGWERLSKEQRWEKLGFECTCTVCRPQN